MSKEKFKLVEKKASFLIEDEAVETERKQGEPTTEQLKKDEQRKKRKRLLITFLVMTAISCITFILGLLWQWEWSLMAATDALTLSFALIFFAGWIMFVWNLNILSPLIHGFKTFGLMLVGKRPKTDYYDYMKKIEEDPIPKYYIVTCFITSGILLIPLIILVLLAS